MHLFHRSETSGQLNHHLLQHKCGLKEKFEECQLTSTALEVIEIGPFDAPVDAFNGTRIIPEV
jgi:hypothetical protein